MSDKITYVLEVLDKYSANTKKFKTELLSIKKAAEDIDEILSKGFGTAGSLGKAVSQTNALASSIDKVTRANQRNASVAINATRSLGNMRKTLAGAYTPIRFNPELGKYEARNQATSYAAPKMGGGGAGISFGNVAKAMGYYSLIDKAVGLPKEIFNTRREFDSLGATLEAVMPKYDRTISAQTAAAREMDYLKTTAYNLGLNLNTAKEEYVKFLASSAGKTSLQDVHKIFEAFAKLSTVYQITPQRFGLVMNALSQMTSKSRVNMEELKLQLGDSLPGALSIFSRAAQQVRPDLVKTEADFYKLVESGRVSSDLLKEVAKVIVNDTDLMAGLDKALGSLNTRTNRLATSWTNLLDNLSKGFIGEGMGAGIEALDNAFKNLNSTINQISESFKIIGETKFGKILGAMASGLGTVLTEGTTELIKAPFKLASTAGAVITAGAMGEGELGRESIKELGNYYNPFYKPLSNNNNSQTPNQTLVIEFLNAPQNMTPIRVPDNMSVRKDGTLSPAGGY